MNWIEAISQHNSNNTASVLVTVLKTAGSSPRDTDAKMVVTVNTSDDSIGGGQLEYQAIRTARELLVENKRCSKIQEYNLSKDMQQCCGGKVTLLFECFPVSDFKIMLFGAGHVGQAIIKILSDISCQVWWIDSRAEFLETGLPANIRTIHSSNPEQYVEECPPDSYYLIMTHDHHLDQALCEAILSRGDSYYCGLIGSKSKAASFRGRFKRKGFSHDEIIQLTSPIGSPELKGKAPMEVAVSVVLQILQLQSNRNND